jgi:hypothetical protein
MLQGLFGGDDDDRRPQARDFISRYETGAIDQGYSDDEAYENFQRVSRHADPETMQRAAEQAFSRMDPSQRAQVAQLLAQRSGQGMGGVQDDPRQMAGMVSRMQRDNPSGLASLFGGGGGPGGGGGIGEAIGNLFGGDQTDRGRSGESSGGFPGGTLGKVALGGIAAFAMKEMLGGGGDDNNNRRRRSV